ncbi:MAG: deoxyribose-phosphate aldolase [Acidobacteriota bacterium]
MQSFRAKEFLPSALIQRVTELRVSDPERSFGLAQKRSRRAQLTVDGKLNILAADHPARRVVAVGTEPLGMADRHDYLARIVRVLEEDSVDGLMATMDILEDLLVLDEIRAEAGHRPLLDNKLLIASLNRGGLLNVSWEMDDPMTGASAATVAAWNFDGAKVLLRICDDERDSLKTIMATTQVINEMNSLRLPLFLEPLPAMKTDRGYKIIRTAEALASIVSVATALGDSSRHLWLKLPYCENYEVVAGATTLPILLLGGESAGNPGQFIRELNAGLAAGANVRGVMVGRNVLYPGNADPGEVAAEVGRLVHNRGAIETVA